MADIDVIMDELDVINLPILIQLTILTLPAILAACHMTAIVFLGYIQGHFCTMPRQDDIIQECNISWTVQQTVQYIPQNIETGNLDSCSRFRYDSINCTFWTSNSTGTYHQNIESCSSWTYDKSVFTSTIPGDFDLVCGNQQKARLSQAIFMVGVTIGVAGWGQFSDRFGRKLATILPMTVGLAVGIAASFSKSFVVFMSLRFFIGFTIFPSLTNGYILATETVRQAHKVWYTQIFQAIYGLGICILSGIAYLVRDWRTLQFGISLPGIIFLILLCFTYESPRWLMSKMKYSKANEVFKKLMTNDKYHQCLEAKVLRDLSSRKDSGEESKRSKENDVTKVEIHEGKATNHTLIDVIKLPNMRKKTLIFCYIWLVLSAVYYGLTLNSADLGGDVFLNLFLSAIVEIPAAFLAIPMINIWGRRPALTSTLSFSGIACVCMMFISKELTWLNVSLSTLGKFSISTAFGAVYIYTIDIYPTPVRNVGFGICSSCARIGGTMAPFIAMLDVIGFTVPYVVFGLMAIAGGLVGLLLPETLGRKIPETLKEAEQFGKKYEGVLARICGAKEST